MDSGMAPGARHDFTYKLRLPTAVTALALKRTCNAKYTTSSK
jgi:hypothetical protein